jgi:hypothetical protein
MALATAVHGKGWLSFPVTGQAAHDATAAGSLGYVVNPEGAAVIITRCVLYGITNSTGAANITVGTAATAVAAHDVANIFAAAAQAASAGTAVQGLACGDPADALVVLAADGVIAAFGSATTVGYTGRCYVEYVHV